MGFNKIFWGFIFLFDFRINGFDILPDFIGFILIYLGLKAMLERNENFKLAMNMSLILIFVSILDVFQIQTNQVVGGSVSAVSFLVGSVVTIMSLILVYKLCLGISELAREIDDEELASKAMNRWMLYLINNILIYVVFVIPSVIIVFGLFIFAVITYILILALMKESERKLG